MKQFWSPEYVGTFKVEPFSKYEGVMRHLNALHRPKTSTQLSLQDDLPRRLGAQADEVTVEGVADRRTGRYCFGETVVRTDVVPDASRLYYTQEQGFTYRQLVTVEGPLPEVVSQAFDDLRFEPASSNGKPIKPWHSELQRVAGK